MRQWRIDAFTSRPFAGNPACVVEPLDAWPDPAWMQATACENNAGATAFLVKGESPSKFSIRWFTPDVEVPLCGHATLAAAHALFDEMAIGGDRIEFDCGSGSLMVRRMPCGYEMRFPAQPASRVDLPDGICEALGVEPIEVWAGPYVVALLETETAVRSVRPNLASLHAISLGLGGQGNVGVAAIAAGREEFDVVDRFFAPGYGIPEDAATGSFHCILAPIMAARLQKKDLRFHQASSRGAELTCRVDGSRVFLTGEAVTMADGSLRIEPADVPRDAIQDQA